MPKPMRVTNDILEQIAKEFLRKLPNMALVDGRISFVQDFVFKKGERVKVEFTRMAYDKMMALVDGYSSEVAWHGLVSKVSDKHYLIDDILVYPQTVSGVTVNTDQEEYDQWLMGIDNDDFNRLKFQGHSHVNMATSPSGTDLQHQSKIISQLGADGFYIFLIINKKRDYTIKVYDAESNALYENDSVDVVIPDEIQDLEAFMKDAEKLVAKYRYNQSSIAQGKKATQTPAAPKYAHGKGEEPIKARTRPVTKEEEDDGIDYDDMIFGTGYHANRW